MPRLLFCLTLAISLNISVPALADQIPAENDMEKAEIVEKAAKNIEKEAEKAQKDVKTDQNQVTSTEKEAKTPQIDPSAYKSTPVHAVAMHGAPTYGADFTHFKYVNPNAPKGGTLRQHVVGTFDSLNPFIAKGISAAGIGLIYQTLTEHGTDEAFTEYGSVAQSIEMPEDRSWIAFNLNPKARWHDGAPLTADDVVWTFNTLIEKGAPFYRAYYANVKHVIAASSHRALFIFDGTKNLELPLIIGQLPVLPKHYWQDKDFTETSLTIPVGSGPYKIGRVEQGRFIEYVRDKDWWAKDLPLNKGRYNFDRLTFDYYRDSSIALEGLFANEYDFRSENTAKIWATGYENDLVKSKKIIKERTRNERPAGMQGFIMNIRRPVFADKEVRKAINLAFDFEWANKQFAFGAYTRTDSYFENSELASFGLPTGRELEILTQFKDKLPPEVFTVPFTVAKTKGDGKNRTNLRQAAKILDKAGYKTGPDGVRVHETTGTRLEFEIVDNQPAFERWTLPLIKNLKKLGIIAKFRIIDSSQYGNRMRDFDFDMTIHSIGQSLSPGNEQREYWHSEKADVSGSRNYIGIKDPVIDALIELVIQAPDRQELIYRTRALDRVLLAGHYLIPQWHINAWRSAYWDKFERPEYTAKQSLGVTSTWWAKPAE